MNIGDRLRKIRTEQNLSAKKLSELSGVPEKTIYRIEKGEVQDPKLSSLEPIIKALNCSADELIFDIQTMGTSRVLKNLFDQAIKLPVDDKVMLIKIIEKWLVADNLRNMADAYFPSKTKDDHEEIIEEFEKKQFDEMVDEEKYIEHHIKD